jgi:hypothetical protein
MGCVENGNFDAHEILPMRMIAGLVYVATTAEGEGGIPFSLREQDLDLRPLDYEFNT